MEKFRWLRESSIVIVLIAEWEFEAWRRRSLLHRPDVVSGLTRA